MTLWVRKANAAFDKALSCERIGATQRAAIWLDFALYCERRAGGSR